MKAVFSDSLLRKQIATTEALEKLKRRHPMNAILVGWSKDSEDVAFALSFKNESEAEAGLEEAMKLFNDYVFQILYPNKGKKKFPEKPSKPVLRKKKK